MELWYPIGLGVVYFAIWLGLNKFFKFPMKFGLYALVLIMLLFGLLMVVIGLLDDTGWLNMGFVVVILLIGYVAATYAALWTIYTKLLHR